VKKIDYHKNSIKIVFAYVEADMKGHFTG